jgi:FkbM family methyltransferase
MIEYRGLYFCDGEVRVIETLEQERQNKGAPDFYGKPTFQFRKFAKSIPLIRNFRVAVDVGAHVGLWARVFARMFAHVDCFEPVLAHVDCLVRNIDHADLMHVSVHPQALGEAAGELTLSWRARNTGITHVVTPQAPNDRLITVPVRTLDSYGLNDVDYLKIDVEGFEANVIKGGEATIRKCRPVIMVEQKPGNPQRYGFDQLAALTLLRLWGYQLAFEFSGDFCMVPG